MKKCTKCSITKPLIEFHRNSKGRFGYSEQCKPCNNERIKIRRRLLRQEVIEAYGGKCQLCSETIFEFLVIDHINGGGNIHRKELGNKDICTWLKRNNYPLEFRILCNNCNQIKPISDNKRRENRERERLEAFNKYGGPKCACCGENKIQYLTIDHVNGGGGKHTKKIGGHICAWLKKENYPPGFRVLCNNCNSSYGLYGYCPHELESAQASIKWFIYLEYLEGILGPLGISEKLNIPAIVVIDVINDLETVEAQYEDQI